MGGKGGKTVFKVVSVRETVEPEGILRSNGKLENETSRSTSSPLTCWNSALGHGASLGSNRRFFAGGGRLRTMTGESGGEDIRMGSRWLPVMESSSIII